MIRTPIYKYHVGYIAQDGIKQADLYIVPAGAEAAAELGICFDPDAGSPVWRVKATESSMDIYYETIPKGRKFPSYVHVPEDKMQMALDNIKKTIGQEAA